MDNTKQIEALRDKWNHFSNVYSTFDSTPQTFYFTLVNMLRLNQAKNVLEIACGTGLLLPYAISIKNKDTHYLATDLAPEMITKAEQKLQHNLELFRSSETLENWMKSQHLVLKACNGEEPITGFGEFDVIICNLVLMLTDDPRKMLRSLHQTAAPGARLGATIWGEKAKSNFVSMLGRALKDLSLPPPKDRSPFYLDQIIDTVVQETGWEIELKWAQDVPFHYSRREDLEEYVNFQAGGLKDYSKEDIERVQAKMFEYLDAELKLKRPMNFSNRVLILRKV